MPAGMPFRFGEDSRAAGPVAPLIPPESLALKYGISALLKARSPLVARRRDGLVARERADPTIHRARAMELLARTFRAAERIPAYAGVAKKARYTDLPGYL